MKRPKILMTMLEVGFGHKGPALAVADALERLYQERFDIAVVDFAKVAGAKRTDRNLKDGWDFSLNFSLPVRLGYSLLELLAPGKDAIMDVVIRDFVAKGVEYLDRYRPDLVFATHPMCLYVAAVAREQRGLSYPLVAYVVDPFDGYSLWAEKRADAIIVASEESRARLRTNGYPDERILRMDFPLARSIVEPGRNREQVRRELGVGVGGRPVILAMSGAQGMGKVFDFVESAVRARFPADFIVVAGRNRKTHERFKKLARKASGPGVLVPLGFATNVRELIDACDVVVGKAGASTTMEAYFLEKPCAFVEWAAQNDRLIIEFALRRELGWYTPTRFSFFRFLRHLVESDDLAVKTARVADLGMKSGSEDVARYLAGLLGEACAAPEPGARKDFPAARR